MKLIQRLCIAAAIAAGLTTAHAYWEAKPDNYDGGASPGLPPCSLPVPYYMRFAREGGAVNRYVQFYQGDALHQYIPAAGAPGYAKNNELIGSHGPSHAANCHNWRPEGYTRQWMRFFVRGDKFFGGWDASTPEGYGAGDHLVVLLKAWFPAYNTDGRFEGMALALFNRHNAYGGVPCGASQEVPAGHRTYDAERVSTITAGVYCQTFNRTAPSMIDNHVFQIDVWAGPTQIDYHVWDRTLNVASGWMSFAPTANGVHPMHGGGFAFALLCNGDMQKSCEADSVRNIPWSVEIWNVESAWYP